MGQAKSRHSASRKNASESRFNIDVRFQGGITDPQRQAFQAAAHRWEQIITADLSTVAVGNETIDDLVIDALGTHIDGPDGILGQAGPTYLRPDSFLPAKGIMEFDTADLARMEANGTLDDVIFHEMGHVLGLGTLWGQRGLVRGAGTANPVFVGEQAMRAYAQLIGSSTPLPVPLENVGGPGTREGHWRETLFGNEAMTGFINLGANPASRLTIAALQDLGYQVNPEAADAYTLPDQLQLARMGSGEQCRMCRLRRGIEPVILSPDALA